MFQPSLLALCSLLNPAFESKYHTCAPDTSYWHSQCLCLLIYKITILLLIQLKGAWRDPPVGWLSSTRQSPPARAGRLLTHHSSRTGALLVNCHGITEGT